MPILYETYAVPGETTAKIIDWWTIAHLAVGISSGLIFKVPTSLWALIAVGWEIIEQGVIVERKPDWKEPVGNSAIDIIIGIAGNYAGNKIREGIKKGTILRIK